MLAEESVSIENRYLLIEGRLTDASLEIAKAGLPNRWYENTAVVFVSYAYADLPIGKQFQYMFPVKSPEQGIPAISRILAVTQQFSKPFDAIPHGWKTICLFEFPQGTPTLIKELPTVNEWGESSNLLCVSSEETWHGFLKKAKVS